MCRLTDSLAIPHSDYNLLAVAHHPRSFALYQTSKSGVRNGNSCLNISREHLFWAFSNPIVSLNTIGAPDSRHVVVCNSEANASTGNLFVLPLQSSDEPSTSTPVVHRNVGTPGEVLWATALHSDPSLPRLAISTSRSIHAQEVSLGNVSMRGYILRLGEREESFSLDWLSPNTIAFSVNQNFSSRPPRSHGARKPHDDPSSDLSAAPPSHGVRLWDTRARGVASRLKSLSRVTGLYVPDYDSLHFENSGGGERGGGGQGSMGTQVLVANAPELALYDLRMAGESARPVLRIPHKSEMPKLELAVWKKGVAGGGGLVAAVGLGKKVPVYSLRTGQLMRVLELGTREKKEAFTGLKWNEDECGVPFLRACCADTVQEWAWKGQEE